MASYFQPLLLALTTIYHAIACWLEDTNPPPGKLIDIGNYKLHLYEKNLVNEVEGSPTIILEHSLGGIEGYFLIDELAKIGRVCVYDRAGFGWSDISPHARTTENIVMELDTLLRFSGIEPPYILVGDSFGSYNVRLYAHRFPQKVVGMVLTDGLHESGMLKMPFGLQALKYFFASGFVMSLFGASLGIIRVFKIMGIFELLKPGLRKFPQYVRQYAIRSFCRPKHWLTMAQEILNLDASSQQVMLANNFGNLPIVSIKADSFFQPSLWTNLIPLTSANQLRETMHQELMHLSTNCTQIQAHNSGHFIWIDEPEMIITAVEMVLEKIETT
jgi:pimeloyl-ACP methyl ester carboxylesterase